MQPKVHKFRKYSITYFNKEELDILIDEIFNKEIYRIDISNSKPIIFDIGSYIGLSTIYFKDKYPNSKIFCFEPNPNIFPLLEENIFANNLQNVILKNIAIGSKDCMKELYIDSSGNAAFSTASFTKDAWSGEQKTFPIMVKTERLSNYVVNDIDLLKIDVEGAEKSILEELEKENKFQFIKNILFEYHPIKIGHLKKIVNLLERNNYKLSYFKEGGKIDNPTEELILVVAQKSS